MALLNNVGRLMQVDGLVKELQSKVHVMEEFVKALQTSTQYGVDPFQNAASDPWQGGGAHAGGAPAGAGVGFETSQSQSMPSGPRSDGNY